MGHTGRTPSSNIEGVILSIDSTTPYAWTFTVRPKQSTQRFASAGSNSLLAGEVLLFGGDVDAGEASTQINPLIHLDFNTNAFINCYEFGCNWEKICDYILYLDGNNELYKYVLAQPLWIRDEIPENLRFDRLKERISAVL